MSVIIKKECRNVKYMLFNIIGVATYLKVGATHTRKWSYRVGEDVGGDSPSHGVKNFSFSRTMK